MRRLVPFLPLIPLGVLKMANAATKPQTRPVSIDDDSSLEKKYDSDFDVPELADPEKKDGRGFWARLFRPLKADPDAVATQPSVFDDPTTLEVYRPPPSYENTHRFDPKVRWTHREDRVSGSALLSCSLSQRDFSQCRNLFGK